MQGSFTIGVPPISVNIRENTRAKRYGLRISPNDGSVWLTVPRGGDVGTGMRFVETKEGWLRKNLVKYETPNQPLHFGDKIDLWGKPVTISQSEAKTMTCDGQRLFVPSKGPEISAWIRGYLQDQARQNLVPATEYFAGLLNRPFGSIRFRDTKSRWGSCSSKGDLMYSYRLAMTPPDVARYVAAHETCHLIEMNHSKNFWTLVASICPEYKLHKKWLRENGPRLMAVRLKA